MGHQTRVGLMMVLTQVCQMHQSKANVFILPQCQTTFYHFPPSLRPEMSDSEPDPRGQNPTPPDSTPSADALRSESDPFSGTVSNPPTQPMTESDAPPTSSESNGKAPAGAGAGEAVKELRSACGALPAASRLPETNSSGEDFKTPVADGMEKRRRRTKSVEVDEPRPTWLPSDWDFIVTVRGQGNSAGTRDRYFIDPKYHHRFRSRIAVEKYLLTGVIEKQQPKSESNKGKVHRSNNEDSKSTLALSHSSEPPNNDISTLEPIEAKRKKRRSRKEGSNHINTLSHSSEPPNNDISTLEPTEAKRKKRRSRKEDSNRIDTLSHSSEPPSNDISTSEPTKAKRKRRRSRKEDSNHINTLLNSSGLPKNGISTPKPTEASKIDFTNLPTTVRWTLTGAEGQVWVPNVVNEEPPETSKKAWAALEYLCSCLEQQIQKSQQSVPRNAAGLGADPNQDVENKEKIIQQSQIEKNAKGVEKLQRERGRKKGPILDRNLLEKLGKDLCKKYQDLHPEEDKMHITSSLKT